MKLRKWVKVVIGVLTIIGAIALLNTTTKNAINQCINNGNSYDFCYSELAK